MILLTIQFFWLMQYSYSMGLTQARMLGLMCGTGTYGAILGFLWWFTCSQQFGIFGGELKAP